MADLAGDILKTAEGTVGAYEEWAKGRLDFTVGSLAVVDELLDRLAEYVPEMTPEQVQVIASDFGCYALEVARRATGGVFRWFESRKQPVLVVGEPAFKIAIATWDTAEARVRGDSAASMPFLYEGFAARVKSAQPGEDALYT